MYMCRLLVHTLYIYMKSVFYLEPSTIAPPPGFGPQKPRESHTTPSTSNNIYSLWGNSGSVQGLFQQNDGQYLLHFSTNTYLALLVSQMFGYTCAYYTCT